MIDAGRLARVAAAAAAAIAMGAWLGSPAAHARPAGEAIPTLTGSGVEIEVTSYFSQQPPSGFIPLQLRIKNGTPSDQTWRFHFESERYVYRFVSEASFAVPKGEEKTFEVEVPSAETFGVADYGYGAALTLTASGYGVTGEAKVLRQSEPNASLAMSETLAARNWEVFKPLLRATHDNPGFDAAFLPRDWRGYSGLGSVWMSETEWDKLAPEPRAAIRSWVATGGMLVLATRDALPASPQENPVPLAPRDRELAYLRNPFRYERRDPIGTGPTLDGLYRPASEQVKVQVATGGGPVPPPWASEPLGFGAVVLIPWDGERLSNTAGALLEEVPHSVGQVVGENDAGGSLASLATPIEVHGGVLMLFLVGFSVVVGPLNLFLFCRGNKRFHLFWTTPLLSIGATLALAVAIFVVDGTGGTGSRWTAVLLLPRDRVAVTVQEQIARTGALLSTRFTPTEPLLLAPVRLADDHWGDQRSHRLKLVDRTYSGQWFTSRTVQAQLLESVQPSRARLEIVASPDAGAGPEVVSSIDATLDQLYVVTGDGRCWSGSAVRTGQRTRLAPVSREDFESWWKLATVPRASARGRWLLESAATRSGWFFATAPQARAAIETLPSIVWKQEVILYLGPYDDPGAKATP